MLPVEIMSTVLLERVAPKELVTEKPQIRSKKQRLLVEEVISNQVWRDFQTELFLSDFKSQIIND